MLNWVICEGSNVADEPRYSPLTLLVSVAFAPGIAAHEYAHVGACHLFGVEVRSVRPLDLLATHAEVVHERVDDFATDLAIGFAPLVVNTILGVGCFLLAARFQGVLEVGSLVVTWVGITLTVTAFPSQYDTETLWRTGRSTNGVARYLAVPTAALLRGVTAIPYVAGVYGFFWTAALLRWTTGTI